MKHLYKFAALFFLFCLSLFFFGKTIPAISVNTETATSLQDSTFPIVYLQTQSYTINTLHGYSSELDSGMVRESITPLNADKVFTARINQNESKIKRLDYELKDIGNNKIIESNSLTAFDVDKNYRIVRIKITQSLDTSKEYGFQITLTTNLSKKIHFYTRLKYYDNDFFLSQKLDFIKQFHNATFKKSSDIKLENYLEANTNSNTSFANVNIHSSKKMITWKNLKPKIISEVVPTIKEINIETASVFQDYYVSLHTDSTKEIYHVKEFYRVRYSGNRIYLLAFNRTMESFFNPRLISVTKSEIKLGVTSKTDFDITSSDDNKKIAFVRNGSLWYYDLKENLLSNVFSFEKNKSDYLRDHYDQHDVRILNMDDSGNINFMVYGYMNCGDYEGRVGILLYSYNAEKNHITERVYIPLLTTYQQLKEDLGKFCYVNKKNIFYFSLNDSVYAYNMSSKRYEILTAHASADHFSMLKSAKCFVWSNSGKKSYADSITILDLDTDKRLTVSAPSGKNIVVLGTIDTNIVYGYAKNSDVYESPTGEIIQPAYQLVISDCKGNILRRYSAKNRYVIGATVEDNAIHLTRVKRSNSKFVPASNETIMNQLSQKAEYISVTTRVTEKMLTEKYISLPAGYEMISIPETNSTEHIMVTDNTTLHLTEKDANRVTKYYIYANGEITQSVTSCAKAITIADKQMGTVMDNKSHIIWERGGRFFSKKISTISYPDDTSSTMKASIQMLLQAAQITVSTSELRGKSMISMLKRHLTTPVSLSGCTLDQILYFVSNEKPVIGMLDNTHAVLITEYDTSSVTWMDPMTRRKRKSSLTAAENLFKKAGYHFISYIED